MRRIIAPDPKAYVSALGILFLWYLAVSQTGCGSSGTDVSLETRPKGANTFVNGEFVGQTPLNLSVSPDTRSIRLEFEGKNALSGQSELRKGKLPSRTLTAAYIPLTANLPLFVALEKGFFTQNGIDVNAIETTSPNDIITGIVSGTVDFAAVIGYTLIFPAAIRYPGTFKLYSSSEETAHSFTSSIITLKDTPIDSYRDLIGKRIGVYTGLVQINFLKAILTGMGIDLSQVEIVKISPRLQIQGLVSGEYDALSSTEPTTNIARLQGIAKVVSENPRSSYIMRPFPSSAAPISTKLLTESPEAARAIVRSLEMAIDYIKTNPEGAKACLPKYTAIPKEREDEILADLKLFKYCKLGEENRLNVQRFADYMHETGLIPEKVGDVNLLFGDYEGRTEE